MIAEETQHYASLLPLAQLFAEDVPDLPRPDDADLLQVLWCPYDAHGGSGAEPFVSLVWRRAGEIGPLLEDPPIPSVVGFEGYVPEPCTLSPERVVEHQDVELLPEGLRDEIEAWEDDEDETMPTYAADLSIAPGWKAGGFASWPVTGPDERPCGCGALMRLLLRVSSSEWDGGNRSWIPAEDRSHADEHAASTPTYVVVGRGGSMNLLVCSGDIRHPHRISIQ